MARTPPDVDQIIAVEDDIDAPFDPDIVEDRAALPPDKFRLGSNGLHEGITQSTCFDRISWEPIESDIRDGVAAPSDDSLGVVTMVFREGEGNRTYVFDTMFTFEFWSRWLSSSSRGRFFVYNVKGFY